MKYITKDEFDDFLIKNQIVTNLIFNILVFLEYNLKETTGFFDYDKKFNLKKGFSRYMRRNNYDILVFYNNNIYLYFNNVVIKYFNNYYIQIDYKYRFKSNKYFCYRYNLSGKLLSKKIYSIKKLIRYEYVDILFNYKIILKLNYKNNMISYIRQINTLSFISKYNYRLYII